MTYPLGTIWEARYLSYSGIVGGASHWQVEMRGHTEDITVGYLLDAKDARAYSDEDFRWKAGDWSAKFPCEKDAIEASKVVFEHLAGEHDVLVGNGIVLAAKDEDRGKILEQALLDEDDGNYEAYDLARATFVPQLHDSVFGHNAPPSVRTKMEVIVERHEDSFRVVDRESLLDD